MGRKKLNFSRKDFKKSDAQIAGFKTKGAALKFFKNTPKNKLDNFKSVGELVEYIKNQKDKLKTFGLDVDFLFKQKPRLTKEQKIKNKKGKELEEQLKVYEEALSGPEEIDSDTFIFNKVPKAKIGWLSMMDTVMLGGRGAGRGSSSTARGVACSEAPAPPTLQSCCA